MTAGDLFLRSAEREPARGAEPASRVIDWPRLRRASRSCCCVARPTVIVVLPPTAGRPHPTELLLCGHHFERSRPALMRARALAFSMDGRRLPVTVPAA
jgi:hypothetical protein